MKEIVEMLARQLVDYPDEVEVREVDGPGGVTLEIYVADTDTGKIIGRGGRVINALRTVAKAASVRDGRRVSVELIA